MIIPTGQLSSQPFPLTIENAYRKRLFPLIGQVNDDQEPIEIAYKCGNAYLVSADQWRALMETAYLLRSPANAEHLLRSIATAEAGRIEVQELIDPQHDVARRSASPKTAGRTTPPGQTSGRPSSGSIA